MSEKMLKIQDFNGDNLISKYGTKFSQINGYEFPAIFVGAIYWLT